jgi:plasmid maintenance system antidote protein VapI
MARKNVEKFPIPCSFYQMSHLSEILTELLDLEEINQGVLAERVKTDRGTISRFCNARLSPTREMLARMIEAVSTKKEHRLKLLLAYLQDEAAACASLAAADYIIAPASAENFVAGIPVSMQESVQVLLRAISNGRHPELRTLLHSLADMVAVHEVQIQKSRQNAKVEKKTGKKSTRTTKKTGTAKGG